MNRRRRLPAALAIGVFATVMWLAGCGAAEMAPPGSAVSPVAAASAPPTESGPSVSVSPRPVGPKPIPQRTARVVGLESPSIGLKANRLEELRLLPDGSLAAPKDPAIAGWYGEGPMPGELGPAILAGHVDSKTGPAVFARLGQLKPGDRVTVDVSEAGDSRRKVRFIVDRIVHASKKNFPTDEVYQATPDAQLRLITCSGPYDRVAGSYEDNTVVFATAENASA